jgi:tetratricopeptide (TPR) repeat protein
MAKEQGFISDTDWVSNGGETIFYNKEKSLKELIRYKLLINELSRLLKGRAEYTEEELKNIMKDEKGVQDLINLAQIKVKDKKLDEAEHILNEAIELNSGSSEAFMNKAVLLAMRKDENCVSFFDKSIKADPENLLAYKNLGLFLFKEKKYNESIDVFKKVIEIEPADVEFYNNLGSVYGMQNNYDKAIETFERALLIDANDKGTLMNLKLTVNKKKAANET